MFFKIIGLKMFANFIGKHLCWSGCISSGCISSGCFWRFRFPACNFIKKETPAKMLFCYFCKMFKNIFSFDRTPPGDCFLCLSVNFNFHFFYKAPLGNWLFHTQVAELQPLDAVKNYFIGAFQVFIQERKVAIWRHSFT